MRRLSANQQISEEEKRMQPVLLQRGGLGLSNTADRSRCSRRNGVFLCKAFAEGNT